VSGGVAKSAGGERAGSEAERAAGRRRAATRAAPHLAAREDREPAGGDRLAGAREPVDGHDQVRVDRADHDERPLGVAGVAGGGAAAGAVVHRGRAAAVSAAA
jgi:hypothetical protein